MKKNEWERGLGCLRPHLISARFALCCQMPLCGTQIEAFHTAANMFFKV